VHQGVAAIHQSVEVGAAPADEPLETGVESAGHTPHVAERHIVKSAGFDPYHDAARDPGGRRHVHLSQAPSEPKRSQCRPDALVFHRGTLDGRPYLRLTGCRFRA
jgi:hypothetical protein